MNVISQRATIAVISVLAAVLLVVGTAAVTFILMHDTRQDISLADIAASDWAPNPTPIMYEGMQDDTEALCAGVAGCIEGFRADHVSYYRFDSRPHAAAFARETPDAYQSDWIVLRFTDDVLSNDDRLQARRTLDELAVSD